MKRKLIINQGETNKVKSSFSLAAALLQAMTDPELKVKDDDLVVIIKDKYPKAEHHYLVLPLEKIRNLKSLTAEHVSVIKHMHKFGLDFVKEQHEGVKFNFGYHAEPSMSQLHLHIISDDMNSTCLKTKKHWNSYTTEFFLKAEDVSTQLEENGEVKIFSPNKCKELLNTPLRCHKCDYIPKNMPDLKIHILNHK